MHTLQHKTTTCNYDNAIHFFLSDQSIYYLSWAAISHEYCYRIVRLDISNPSHLTAQAWSPDDDQVEDFTADSEGNIAYSATLNDDYKYRLKYHGGRLTNTDERSIWTGTDGCLYKLEETEDYNVYNYNRIDFDSDGYPLETTICTGPEFEDRFPISLKNIQYFIYDSDIIEIDYNTPSVTSYDPGIEIKDLDASDDFFYLLGDNGNIHCFEPGTGNTTSILSSDYNVYSFSVSSDNCVEFNALRMSDGKKILGKLENADTLTGETDPEILDSSMDSEVVSLVRIK